MNEQIITIIASVLSGGLITHLLKYKERNVEMTAALQKMYKSMFEDLEKEMGELKEEVFMLRKTVKAYYNQCKNCPNFKYGKDEETNEAE